MDYNSPHPPQQSHQQAAQHPHHNHQTNMTGQLPQQNIGSQHVHSQSPHHHGPPQVHLHSQQQINTMIRPQIGNSMINHHQPGLNQPHIHHQQNFFGGGPQSGLHYHQPNHHHHHQPNHHHHHHHNQAAHHHIHHQTPVMHHGLPPPLVSRFPHHVQQNIGRNSPHFMNILQTEFRMLEFNRRLQCRPLRFQNNPMPSQFDEHSLWWDKFALEFFDDDATLTLRLILEEKPLEYTIGRTLIPRFFRTYFDGGVTDLSINLRNPRETSVHPHMITLDCDQAYIITNNIFKPTGMPSNHGIVVHTEGNLTIDFVNNYDSLVIKSWRFNTRRSHEYIDRTILTTMGLPNNYLSEPITRQGLTKSTISYLKMCMIMEPMQELMYHHKQSKMDPRSCLRKLLFDRYKFRSTDDARVATNKKRKRKSTATPIPTTKRSKANANNPMGVVTGLNNNVLMSPSAVSGNFLLASQDVMVVGEPSMMGGDFGDDNERMITRLENTQYDPSVSAPPSADESSNATRSIGETNTMNSQPVEGESTTSQPSHNEVESPEEDTKKVSPIVLNEAEHNSSVETSNDTPVKENNINHLLNTDGDAEKNLNFIKVVSSSDSTSENHSNVLHDVGIEANSDPQLICTTTDSSSTLDKNQPVNNGIA